MRSLSRLAAPIGVLSLIACSGDRPPEPAALPPPRTELSGCAAVLAGPVCEVTPAERAVRLWIDGGAGAATVRVAGAEVAVQRQEVHGGLRLSFEVPEPAAREAGAIAVEIARREGTARLQIPVRPADLDPRLARTQALRREGKLDEAERALPPPAEVAEEQRGRFLGLRARLALSRGRAEDAAAGLIEAMRVDRAGGRSSDAASAGFAAAFTLLTRLRRLGDARAALAEAQGAAAGWPDGSAHAAYYRGLIEMWTGDAGRALAAFGEAERVAERLGIAALRLDAMEIRAALLGEHGRYDEALSLLAIVARDLPGLATSCRRANLAMNTAWTELLSWQARPGRRPEDATRDRILTALRTYENECAQPEEAQNAHVDLAMWALAAGDLDLAEKHAALARGAAVTPRAEVALWLEDVEARIALARGAAARAVAAYETLRARARAAAIPHVAWRAEVGRGQALEALGKDAGAEAAYRAAEALLSEESLVVPLMEGRAAFLGDRARSARRLADLLVRRGRAGEALAVLRDARSRAVAAAQRPARLDAMPPADRARYEAALSRYLAARAELDRLAAGDWKLSKEKLAAAASERERTAREARDALAEALGALGGRADGGAARAPAEGELLVFLDDRDATVRVLAAAGSKTRALDLERPPAASGAELGARLWDALSAELAETTRVTLSVDGSAAALDLHAAPWRGAPLAWQRPVAFTASALAGGARPARAGPRSALVVADPGEDLPGARDEARAVAAALSPAWSVARLEGDEADQRGVSSGLAGVELLHFAGHGRFDAASTWESRLVLAGSSYLSIGDIVTLPGAPRFVVLSGCETGKAAAVRHAVDMSLAAAFLAAGSEAVIAVARPVRDDLASALSAALYAPAGEPGWDPVAALPAALAKVAAASPEADWSAYRAWVR